MTDAEVRQQVERTDAFIAAFRELIASTVVDPASPCEATCRSGLERIAATVDAVGYVTFCNLADWPPPKRQPQAPWRLFHRGCDAQHSQGQVHVLNWHLRYGQRHKYQTGGIDRLSTKKSRSNHHEDGLVCPYRAVDYCRRCRYR